MSHWLESTIRMGRYTARKTLGEEMSAVSERRYSVRWADNIEYTLWQEVLDGRHPELAALALRAGGWWSWSKGRRRFHSAQTWLKTFYKFKIKQRNVSDALGVE